MLPERRHSEWRCQNGGIRNGDAKMARIEMAPSSFCRLKYVKISRVRRGCETELFRLPSRGTSKFSPSINPVPSHQSGEPFVSYQFSFPLSRPSLWLCSLRLSRSQERAPNARRSCHSVCVIRSLKIEQRVGPTAERLQSHSTLRWLAGRVACCSIYESVGASCPLNPCLDVRAL